jgi:hypothetical protein
VQQSDENDSDDGRDWSDRHIGHASEPQPSESSDDASTTYFDSHMIGPRPHEVQTRIHRIETLPQRKVTSPQIQLRVMCYEVVHVQLDAIRPAEDGNSRWGPG